MELSCDFLASFFSSLCTFLQQKKAFEAFDFIFGQKLGLLPEARGKFGRHGFGLFGASFSKPGRLVLEQLLTCALLGDARASLELQTRANEHFADCTWSARLG